MARRTEGLNKHFCHATACQVLVPPEMLMCRRHWFMVPIRLRKRVWETYRDGQCDDLRPSLEYCKAAKAAVMAVAVKERVQPDTQLYDFFIRQFEPDLLG